MECSEILFFFAIVKKQKGEKKSINLNQTCKTSDPRTRDFPASVAAMGYPYSDSAFTRVFGLARIRVAEYGVKSKACPFWKLKIPE